MTNEIQQTRYDRLLRRVSGIIGPGSKVGEVLTELFPVLDVESVPGELLRLSNTFIAFGGTQLAGAAGSSPRVQIFNPIDSGNIITVSHFEVASSTIDTIRYGVDIIPLTTAPGLQVHRDLRSLPPILPVGQIRTDITVALAPATGLIRVVANDNNVVEDPNGIAVLVPGSGFQVGSSLRAATIWVTFFWRERAAQPSELSL